jgi:threonyl-tRNA synthetase
MDNSLEIMRHSAAHVLAAAVMELWPAAKLGVGPVVDNGFYYDIDPGITLTPNDLARLEKRMNAIMARNEPFRRQDMPIAEAITFFRERKQDLKVELLTDLLTKGTTAVREDEVQELDAARPNTASIYWTGKFVDLCRGPHVTTSKEIGAFKLTKIAGAYWRGNAKNRMLQRVYGAVFATAAELDAYLKMQEEAEKRDHRKIGMEQDLFTFSPLVGAGLPMFTPRGTILRHLLEELVASLNTKYDYERVWIPHITKLDLYKTSGHAEKFNDDIFYVSSKKSDDEFALKPMNCPHHTQIYASRLRSYRDLPIRYAENTTCYRDENTGQLAGLMRVRSLTQDDAHIFCTPEQVEKEITGIYQIIKTFYKIFKMPWRVRLSVHDPKQMEKYLGGAEVWENSVATLKKFLAANKLDYELGVGEAAFYGPKLDFITKDAIGREWQLATAQLDFNLPERFKLEYTDTDGQKKRPVMIHRAILGSVERFLGVAIEHFAGAFPSWLALVQVAIVPVGKEFSAACKKLSALLVAEGMRVEVYDPNERVGHNIRKAITMKVPYMLVIGEKEKSLKNLTVRARGSQTEKKMATGQFIKKLKDEIEKNK